MRLDGIHHITNITADGPRNVDFYARVLGLRMVKQSVNQDDPTVYHLFYADEDASPGADITFFEYPGVHQGRPGAGMIHTIAHRVRSADALDFWRDRLADEGVEVSRASEGALRFEDPEGLDQELVVDETEDEPLVAYATEVPDEYALRGFDHVRAYSVDADASLELFEALAFEPVGEDVWESRGPTRGGRFAFEPATGRGIQGAGTVHHVAWSAGSDEDHLGFRERAIAAGARATPVIDRFYFRSIYFREPNGVLFELATHDPGFDVDEPKETLGERLSLPPKLAGRRAEIEPNLRPLPDTRPWRKRAATTS